MRNITEHLVADEPNPITVQCLERLPGAPCHRYEVTGFDTSEHPVVHDEQGYSASFGKQVILFQCGSPDTHGINGITSEVLLAIVADRLENFQAGPNICIENRDALSGVRHALIALKARTAKRLAGY